jgi:cytochrome d ubiquinol oxidase subunit I
VIVFASGLDSAIFVTIANAWMNIPTGFTLVNGQFINIHTIAAMRNPTAFPEVLHMVLAAIVQLVSLQLEFTVGC